MAYIRVTSFSDCGHNGAFQCIRSSFKLPDAGDVQMLQVDSRSDRGDFDTKKALQSFRRDCNGIDERWPRVFHSSRSTGAADISIYRRGPGVWRLVRGRRHRKRARKTNETPQNDER